MNITKDPKIISRKVIDRGSGEVVGFDVGPSLGEVEGNVSYEGMIKAIEKGQKYQIQASDSADPANVTVKDVDGQKVIVSGRDGSNLNNLGSVKERYIGNEKEEEEEIENEEEINKESKNSKGAKGN